MEGVESLNKLAGDHFIAALSVEKWHDQLKLGKRILCDHNKEKMWSFLAVNFSKLEKAAEVISAEDLKAILEREDLNAKTKWLLGFLKCCNAFHSLPDHEKSKLKDNVLSVDRKPPRVLLTYIWESTYYHPMQAASTFEVYNCLNNTWSLAPDSFNLPEAFNSEELEVIDNRIYSIGGDTNNGEDPRGEI